MARHLRYGGELYRQVSSPRMSWKLSGALFENHSEPDLPRCLSEKTRNKRIWGPWCLEFAPRSGLYACLSLRLRRLFTLALVPDVVLRVVLGVVLSVVLAEWLLFWTSKVKGHAMDVESLKSTVVGLYKCFEGAICLTCGKWLIEWSDKVRLRCVAVGEAQNVEAIEMIGRGFRLAG